MGQRSRRAVLILESAIDGICRDVGLACTDYDGMLVRLERDGLLDFRLSAPVGESLRNLLAIRREVMSSAERAA